MQPTQLLLIPSWLPFHLHTPRYCPEAAAQPWHRAVFVIDAAGSRAHSPLYLFGLGDVLFMCSLVPVQAEKNGERLIPGEKK